jgi:hypothetical protein
MLSQKKSKQLLSRVLQRQCHNQKPRVCVRYGGCHQWRLPWDGGTMMQWDCQQWRLWPMVAAVMVMVVVNCAAAIGAAATSPSLAYPLDGVRQKVPLKVVFST